jgi:hypothetical protein
MPLCDWANGGGGIRTLGRPMADNGFRDRPVQPLRHPSGASIVDIAGGRGPLRGMASASLAEDLDQQHPGVGDGAARGQHDARRDPVKPAAGLCQQAHRADE